MDRDEMRQRMAQHPRAVTFNEARRVLEAWGWELRRVAGSHHVFTRGTRALVIPLKRPHIKQVYVKDVLAATQEDTDGDDA